MAINYNRIATGCIIGIALLGSAIVGNMMADPASIHFSKELNPLHGISILVSFACLIWVSTMLDTQKESVKKKRECTQKRLTELCNAVDELREYVMSPDEKRLTAILQRMKRLEILGRNVSSIIQKTKIPKSSLFSCYQDKYSTMWNLLTLYSAVPHATTEDPDIRVSDDVIQYGFARKSEIALSLDDLTTFLSSIEIAIYD